MEIIKNYIKFLESIEISDHDPNEIKDAKNTLNDFEEDISEFNQKKQSLSNLINNSDGKDVSKDIEKIVGKTGEKNGLLSKYLTILTLQKNILKQQDRLKYYTELKKQRISNKSEANSLDDPDERKDQIDSLNQQLADINDKSTDMNKKLNDNKKLLKDKEKDLDTYIKDTKKRFDDANKKLMK